jgi:hypothetical protein
MNYSVVVAGSGLTYTISVMDPSLGTNYVVYTTNQNGSGVITKY